MGVKTCVEENRAPHQPGGVENGDEAEPVGLLHEGEQSVDRLGRLVQFERDEEEGEETAQEVG